MARPLPLAAAAVLALLPVASRPAPPAPRDASGGAQAGAPSGRIESEEGRFEILGRPLRAGDRIELPEGYLVVEEDGPEVNGVGSFGVVAAGSLARAAPAAALDAPGAGDPAAASPSAVACAAERSAYLAELWRASGIEVKDPAALLDGLEAGATGPATGYYWFALQTDPFRPLAWSSALRARAEALVRCVRDGTPLAASPAGPPTAAPLTVR